MARKSQLPLGHLLAVARNALRMTQREFGPALGVSHRTASRWDTGRSAPSEHQLRQLAALLVPVDRSLAEEAAAHAHDTLEELGLVPPPPPPLPPPAPAKPPVTTRDLVDAVVCAGAEASDASPRALRPVLYVAFQRAHELGLTVEEVTKALAPVESVTPRSARASSTGRTPQPT
jgi:transcriptional regulator with XRE-family HTH domain